MTEGGVTVCTGAVVTPGTTAELELEGEGSADVDGVDPESSQLVLTAPDRVVYDVITVE